MNHLRVSLLPALLLLAIACGGKKSDGEPAAPTTGPAAPSPAPATPPPSGDATAKATEVFSTRCTPCHGASGKGDGVASKGLTPPPRDFSDPGWQASVTDEHLEKIIKFGGAAVGKSPAMPGNPDLTDPAVIAALRAHIRSLGGK